MVAAALGAALVAGAFFVAAAAVFLGAALVAVCH